MSKKKKKNSEKEMGRMESRAVRAGQQDHCPLSQTSNSVEERMEEVLMGKLWSNEKTHRRKMMSACLSIF